MPVIKSIFIVFSIVMIAISCSALPGDMEQPVEYVPGDVQTPQNTPTIPENAQRGEVYISETQLLVMESYPVQLSLVVNGDLPTPCHQFQADVPEPDANNAIHVQVYSLVNPDTMCVEVLKPFEQGIAIPMHGQVDGQYSVWLNGELVGEFSYPG